jgi:hypothetical protein
MGNNGPLRQPPLWIPLHTLLVGYLFITVDYVLNWVYLSMSIAFLLISTIVYIGWRGYATWIDAVRKWGMQMRAYTPHMESIILLGCWLLVPVLLPFLLSKVVGPIYMPRYTIGALPALCIFLALGMTFVRNIVPEFATLGALLILITPGLQHYYVQEYKDQWIESAHYVELHAGPDDAVVFVSINNEPAVRMQRIFNRYYSGPLTQCTIDAGLIPADEAVHSLQQCGQDHARLWMITRESKEDSLDRVESLFFAPAPAHWRVVEQQPQVGITIHLLEAQ